MKTKLMMKLTKLYTIIIIMMNHPKLSSASFVPASSYANAVHIIATSNTTVSLKISKEFLHLSLKGKC